MSAGPEVPRHTLEKQRRASDPAHSVWVSANAGSGKTHVLTQRVVRLLLEGVAPSRILCLTFTKAAAANMAKRVFDALALWTRLPDVALRDAILETGAPEPCRAALARARKLFAHTVETPGGLKIQTIHAFCEKLLHHFPFEANVPSRFEVADDLRESELLARARREVLAEATASGGALGQALARVSDECDADQFEKLIHEALSHRAWFRAAGLEDPEPALRNGLGLETGRTEAAVVRAMVEGGPSPERLDEIAGDLDRGTKTDRANAALLRLVASGRRSGSTPDEGLDTYLGIFFTKTDTRRQDLLGKTAAAARPDVAAALLDEQDRLDKLREERKAAAACERSMALVTLVGAILDRYGVMKNRRGVLDFDDLIERTSVLLERSDAAWVLYKLDSGIDHVLVDEAQDTSEPQWRILDRLTADFAAGASRSGGSRTFFAVGDEKQSIFAFRGAAPQMFAAMRRNFEKRFAAAALPFEPVSLNLSFRSVPGVLDAVDRVFALPEHQKGLVTDDIWMRHEARKAGLPGLVEIWPTVEAKDDEPRTDWRLPLDYVAETDPQSLVARRVATAIARLVAEGSEARVHDGKSDLPRRIRPADIMVLVRRRGLFFEAVIRALKAADIPVAGADRLVLAHHIAVKDLVAAGRAALVPEDDLTLACILKSPLLGLDDEDLLALAPDRPTSLHAALAASPSPRHQGALEKLDRWRERVAEGPFAFYARLLGEDGGRRALEARLGPEARDAIDEFLRLALMQDEALAPSLQSFLAEVEAMDGSIKRDMETAPDCVRVMTVHAAKGLEAKVVFLPDTCSAPSARHDPKLFRFDEGPIVWSPGKTADTRAIAAARERAREAAEEEYRRLLYVALTRAEERVYIAGFYNRQRPGDACWSEMIARTLSGFEGIEKVPAFWDPGETIARLVSNARPLVEPTETANDAGVAAAPLAVPPWLFVRAAAEPAPATPIRPSSLRAMRAPSTRAGVGSIATGLAIHRLLQVLPSVPPEARHEAAKGRVATPGGVLPSAAARPDPIAAALGVIDLPALAELFGPGSRAEVSVAGHVQLPSGARVAVGGRVDRIAVIETAVLVADFKTGRAPEKVPEAHAIQMALYRAALAPLWPQHRLEMLLVWTEGPSVVRLDDRDLDQALATFEAAAEASRPGEP
jgi:ATP-dependent helicase/nuclease subunit A